MRQRIFLLAVLPIAVLACGGCGPGAGNGGSGTALAAPTASAAPVASAAPAASAAAGASAADKTPAGDWSAYNRTLSGDRFSPLAEIDRGNVAKLQSACNYALPEVSALQTGPLVIAGTMYFTTETRSYAIDAASCAAKWVVERPLDKPSALAVHRGFAYADGRLFRGTSDAHVLALDAKDGHTLWDHEIAVKTPGMTMPMAPIAANGLCSSVMPAAIRPA